MLVLVWLCLLGVPSTFASLDAYTEKYKEWTGNAEELPKRLLRLMWSYHVDASQRITEFNHYRFMYEESPHYETGYLMHEVIERYKKIVEEYHRIADYKTNTLYDLLERLEQIQKLYFEIYHLVNMIHEIPKKWNDIGEFGERPSQFNKTLFKQAEKNIEKQRNKKRLRQKMKQQMLKQRRELIKKGLIKPADWKPGAKRDPYNTKWPLDYGWEIDPALW